MTKKLYHPHLDGVTHDVDDDQAKDWEKAGWTSSKPKHYTGPADLARSTNLADVPRVRTSPATAPAATAGSPGPSKKDK